MSEIMVAVYENGVLPAKQGQVDLEAEEKWRELFEKLKQRPGKPLSEIIIEDRGEW